MSDAPSAFQLLIYRSEDGRIRLDVRFEGETVWLSQQMMAELFESSKQNVGQHLKSIFKEGELIESAVVKKYFTTAADGKSYLTSFYNLDAPPPPSRPNNASTRSRTAAAISSGAA